MPILPPNHVSMYLLLEEILHAHKMRVFLVIMMLCMRLTSSQKRPRLSRPYRMIPKIPSQVRYLNRLTKVSDSDCVRNLRMDRNTFARLCQLLTELGGLRDRRYICVEEQVAMFLSTLAHHKKNSVVSFNFQRSGQTISFYLHLVLRAVIKLHSLFLVKPTPVQEDCDDTRWKWFQGCIGALDGTYSDKPRYRNRKGQITTNTLAACDRDLKFLYVLPGWEGSAADGRVLRDAVSRPFGLKVPLGSYYLCDNAYANSDGFLTPYKGVRYHLKEWGPDTRQPQNAEEMFNMRHTKARNVIERAFGILKMRWGILRSASYFPVKIQNRLIMACFLIHNFIRSEMVVDPIELMVDDLGEGNNEDFEQNEEYVAYVEPTTAWNQKRAEMAQLMWQT